MIPFDARILAVYSLETKQLEQIAQNIDAVPSWLPDSRRFVFESENKVFVADSETKKIDEVQIKGDQSPRMRIRSPFVSRDGNLLYYAIFSSQSDIWLLDLTQNP
ncbi:hypothetical protein BH10ACI2_BH10ACI2_15400 [soil metagenome]